MSMFENGSYNGNVDNLVLFTDTTKVLTELRNEIYVYGYKNNSTIEEISRYFIKLYFASVSRYRQEIKESLKLNAEQKNQFCNIYANRFKNWIEENKEYDFFKELYNKSK
jgi:NOL1/NOP2/fmu family ribosome biogenesis protein